MAWRNFLKFEYYFYEAIEGEKNLRPHSSYHKSFQLSLVDLGTNPGFGRKLHYLVWPVVIH